MPGIKSLSSGVQCKNTNCPISLQSIKSGSDRVIQMYDGQCYYTKYIYTHIINLIRKGFTLGHDDFVLPNRYKITLEDLKLLHLNPANFTEMVQEWRSSPEYAAERAQREEDALAQAREAAESDTIYIPVMEDTDGMHAVDTVLRWGVQIDRDEVVDFPIDFINNVDNFLLPPGYDNRFDHNDDENMSRRIRNIGRGELQHIGDGYQVPEGVALEIRFMHDGMSDIYNSLEELAAAMGKTVEEIRGNTTHLRIRAEGGRKTKRTKRKRTRRRY